jgi:Asp-tRNA(Asn)/Glu-tRNA(Gln) amidotransferase A subunit family amidase
VAKERRVKLPKNKPVEWATWQEIIKSIRDAHAEIGKTKLPGQGKDEALAFYSGALAHLEAFKDKYRNLVMHVREDYDEHQAASAMMHVREFMAGLSTKIGENPKPIRWKFR